MLFEKIPKIYKIFLMIQNESRGKGMILKMRIIEKPVYLQKYSFTFSFNLVHHLHSV